MKKIFSLFLIAVFTLAFTGCGDEDDNGDAEDNGDENGATYDQYYDGGYRNNRNGTVDIINSTAFDMLLFDDETISLSSIIGGVRAGSRTLINFADKDDYQSGAYTLIQAVKESEFKEQGDLAAHDFATWVIYGAGRHFTTSIDVSTRDGDFSFTVTNLSAHLGLELREGSPDGIKIAFLTPGETRRSIHTSNDTAMTLFPVWVSFDSTTMSLIHTRPTSENASQTVTPALQDPPALFF